MSFFFFVPFCLISTAALTAPRPHPHSNRNFRHKFVLFIFTATARICRSDRDCVSFFDFKSLLCLPSVKERTVHVTLTVIPEAPGNVFHQTC